MPDNLVPQTGGTLTRDEGTSLVRDMGLGTLIYRTPSELGPRPSVELDRDVLVTSKLKTKLYKAAAEAARIAVYAISDCIVDWWEGDVEQTDQGPVDTPLSQPVPVEPAPGPGGQSGTQPTVVVVPAKCEVKVEVSNTNTNSSTSTINGGGGTGGGAGGGTDGAGGGSDAGGASGGTDGGTGGGTGGGTTTNPSPTPDPVPDAVPDEDTGDDPSKVAEAEGNQLTAADHAFDKIMKSYLAMNFDSSQSAAAYLQQEVAAAGLELVVGADGYRVASTLPDPLDTAGALAEQGITDAMLVQEVVMQTNGALAALEGFLGSLQATVPAGPPSPNSDPYAQLVGQWAGLVPNGFSIESLATEGSQPATNPSGGASVADPSGAGSGASSAALPRPRTLMTLRATTPSGAEVVAALTTEVTLLAADDPTTPPPGYVVRPFHSIFSSTATADPAVDGRLPLSGIEGLL